jgi:hypothetical protein
MRRKLLLVTVLFLLVLVVGCGKQQDTTANTSPSANTQATSEDTGYASAVAQVKPGELALKMGAFKEKIQTSMGMGPTYMEVEGEGMIGNIGDLDATFDKITEKFYAGNELQGITILTLNKKEGLVAHFSVDKNPKFDVPAGNPVVLKANQGMRIPIESANSYIGARSDKVRVVEVTAENDGVNKGRFLIPIKMDKK